MLSELAQAGLSIFLFALFYSKKKMSGMLGSQRFIEKVRMQAGVTVFKSSTKDQDSQCDN